MIAKEKVARYLKEHTRPVLAKTIAHHYLLSKRTVQQALKELENEGRIFRFKDRKQHFWSWVRVAVPQNAPQVSKPSTFTRPIQNSYPTIRGYDD
jgi:predicted transcriptional regulator